LEGKPEITNCWEYPDMPERIILILVARKQNEVLGVG
jgi:hypothetical protein